MSKNSLFFNSCNTSDLTIYSTLWNSIENEKNDVISVYTSDIRERLSWEWNDWDKDIIF